ACNLASMHYEESKAILDKINSCGRILVSCHKDPDPDSIGSALAFRNVLIGLGKSVEIVCVSQELFDNVSYLPGYSEIKTAVDFSTFNYSGYDLFLILDSSSVDRVTGDKNLYKIPIPKIVIDHHETNTLFGDINLIDKERASVGEILNDLLEDFNFVIDQNTADCLMAAIVGDTGAFKFPSTSKRTFEIVIGLMDKGADKNKAVSEIYMSEI
ncbi:MAG: RecJ-like protein phosphoesterase domain-containing protein, partial [Candidatus Woesebacteria bacterium GW2011_GWA1_39_21]